MKNKKKHYIKVLSMFFFLLFPLITQASLENIRFERIGADAGLSQQTIMAIYQDSRGYMWFGTQEGLNKFDGIKFTSYQPKYDDPDAISSGWINSISEDSDGNLWVGTRDGVNILDIKTNSFTHFTASENIDSLNDSVSNVVHTDKNDIMWVGTRKGLNQYLASEKRFKHHNFYGDSENKAVNIRAIAEDIAGAFWLGTGSEGLMRFDPITEQITSVSKHFMTPLGEKKIGIRSLFLDKDQVLWIGTQQSGLFKLDLTKPKTDEVKHSVMFVNDFGGEPVLALSKDLKQTLWAGTNDGLYYKKYGDINFVSIEKLPNAMGKIVDDEIWSLYSDTSGVFWVGTFNGLHKWNIRTTQFDHLFAGNHQQSLSSNKITMVGSDNKFSYIGTPNGVDLINKETGVFSSLPLQSNDSDGLKERVVMSFAYVNEQEIWFGYRSNGATKYNPTDNTFKHYAADHNNDKALGSPGVTSILSGKDNTVWLSTFNGGLSKYNRKTDDFTTYWHDPTDISTIGSDRIITLHEANDGNIWAGTWDAGLSVIVPSTGTVFRIPHNKQNPQSLGSNRVLTILEDSSNNFWIGTLGSGINILTARNKEKGNIVFEKLDTANGMPSDVVYGLLEDSMGNIWSSTNKGLVKIESNTRNISTYKVAHGLQGNEFNSGSHHKDAEGFLYFGGNNGVTRFHPKDIKLNPIPPKIDFTGFQQLNTVGSINAVLNEEGAIEISYTDYLIGFEFAAFDYVAPNDNEYVYKLEGFDKDWIDVRDSRRATYTNLPSGDYIFRVKAANSDGVWNEEGKSIALVVNPAPWFSWWAYAIYSFLTLIAVLYVVRFYRRKAELREQYQIQLQKEVSIRTSELQEANEQLLQASITDQLTGLHNRRYLSDVIEERLEQIKRRFAESILDDKMNASSGPRLMALMFDLDGFKPINDNYGHDAGDKVIIQVATLLKNECRENDIVIRWGGDEYMIVAVVDDLDEAKHFAERVRQSISTFAFDVGLSKKFNLSSSLGFALYPFSHYAPHSITWDQVHLLADHALYKSKDAGRNTWTGIIQSESELPFSVLNSLVPNVDKAIDSGDVLLTQHNKQK